MNSESVFAKAGGISAARSTRIVRGHSALPATDDDHRISTRGKLLGFPLPDRRRIADGAVFAQLPDLLPQDSRDRLPLFRRICRLRCSDGLVHLGQLLCLLRRRNHIHGAVRPSARTANLGMLRFADHNHRRAVSRSLIHDTVKPCHEGTRQVNDLAPCPIKRLQHIRRNAVAADQHLPPRCLFDAMDWRNALLCEHVNDRRVMRQLAKRTAGYARFSDLHRFLDRTTDTHTEARVGSNLNRQAKAPFRSIAFSRKML